MNVLVTGGTGFFGKALVSHLQKAPGNNIVIANSTFGNLTDYAVAKDTLNSTKYDKIYHLAAVAKPGTYCLYNSGRQWLDNQAINTNMLRLWCEEQSQAKLIAIGTSCSYADDINMSEWNYLSGDPEEGISAYAYTKRMLYIGLKAIKKQFPNMQYQYFIPATLYGPNFEEHDNHFIFDLIRKIYRGKKYGEEVRLWGDGLQTRELIHVNDAIRLMDACESTSKDILNITTTQSKTICQFAEMICDIVGYPPYKIVYDTSKYSGIRHRELKNDQLREAIGNDYIDYLGLTSLVEGIKNAVKYYDETFGNR